MKFFSKYIFPALFGFLVYVAVRVINDTIEDAVFWKRSWVTNSIEIGTSIMMGYVMVYLLRRLFKRFDREMSQKISYKTILYELLWVFITVEVCNNLVLTPMAALTDDGLSWGDVASINIIPLLCCLLYYSAARSYKLLQAYVDNKLLLEKKTNDHLTTELKFLRAQYHPHFLFNALNTIYFQMDDDIGEAKKTVEKFSELLRYQLYDQQQKVALDREISYLENFIALQKIRSSAQLNLIFQFDDRLNGEQVYPLLFVPLIENAFKYVGGTYDIVIDLKKTGDGITFFVKNSIPALPVNAGEIKGGIGLKNLKRRLELLYPGRHQLSSKEEKDFFSAELILKLKE